MKEYEDVNDCVMDDWKELEEKEIDDCLIMRIKKLKRRVKNLVQQVIGSCILAFTKNKKEKQDEQTTYEKAEKYAISQKPDDEQAQPYIIDSYLKGAEELEKAKKIIEILVFDLEQYFNLVDFETLKEHILKAKQFLKEIEK